MRTRSLLLALPLLASPLFVSARGAPHIPAQGRRDASPDWGALWLGLPSSTNACPDTFDYFPDGGMRSFYCHLLANTSMVALRDAAGVSVFLSGPHGADGLTLNSEFDFGHYNPDFVRWLGRNLIPGTRDPAFRERTQPIYDASVGPLARIYQVTRDKLRANPGCAAAELEGYRRFMAAGVEPELGAYHDRWFYFLNDGFCEHNTHPIPSDWFIDNGFDGGVDGNLVKGVVGFWLRRSIDGTDALFAKDLRRLLMTYDAAWFQSDRPLTPSGPPAP